MKLITALLLALTVQVAGTQGGFLGAVAYAIRAVETDLQAEKIITGPPVFIDVASVQSAAKTVTSLDLTVRDVQAGLGRPFTAASRAEAVWCTEKAAGVACGVKQNGVHYSLDSPSATDRLLAFNVMSITTETRGSGASATCTRVYRFEFEKQTTGWRPNSQKLLRTC